MGHAVYSLSDPRAVVFKNFVHQLADAKGRSRDFEYYNTIERLAPKVIAEKRHIYKGVSTNVDFYSGFVYDMLGIPVELYTPIFAIARIVGWSAHRMEELVNMDKIIRPVPLGRRASRESRTGTRGAHQPRGLCGRTGPPLYVPSGCARYPAGHAGDCMVRSEPRYKAGDGAGAAGARSGPGCSARRDHQCGIPVF